MFYDIDLVDVYSILEILRQELRTMEGLHKVGIGSKRMSSLLALDFGDDSSSQQFAIDIRDSAINWINDIEKDLKYYRWSTSLMELLRPTFPGMMRQVRPNLFNLMLIIDPTDPESLDIVKLVESFIMHTAPIRIGIVFKVNDSKALNGLDDAGVAMQCALNYAKQSKDGVQALGFIRSILSTAEGRVTVDDVKKQLLKQYSEDPSDILGEDSDYDFGRQLIWSPWKTSRRPSCKKLCLKRQPSKRLSIGGKLTDSDDVVDYIMNQQNVMPRLNERVLNKDKLLQLSPRDMTATALENLRYFLLPRKGSKHHTMTYWIAGDLDCEKSRGLLLDALEYLKSASDVRVVLAALQALPSEKALDLVLRLLRNEAKSLEDREKVDVPVEVSSKIEAQELNLKMLRIYCQRVLNLKEGERAVIANGRVLGPLEEDETFTADDFNLLERFTSAIYLEKITELLSKEVDEEEDITSDSLMKIISLLVSRPQTKSRFDITFGGDEHSVVKIPAAHPDQVAFDLVAIMDPVSRGRKNWAPFYSFYRFVLDPEIQFGEDGKQLPGAMARFSNMPTSPLLTQNYHVPENWLVEVVRSVYDLDNIRLENVDSNVHSEYELEYLLLEGHCFEQATGSPPRGLQITLGTESRPVIVDTIVMANLGYFQLKANPGAWLLRLRQGRSADIYDIVRYVFFSKRVMMVPTRPRIQRISRWLLSSFKSHIVKLRVQKKPDKMNVDLLADEDNNSGIWSSITSSFKGSDDDTDEKLNIFSLASGHLYERFLRIMMLSVLKHTKTPVKFWFLKKLPVTSNKGLFTLYGEKNTASNTNWCNINGQDGCINRPKNRESFGVIKSSSLDVLFPLDVKKIIFVDADQVVRADLKELQQLDLGGAPYHGYWKNHLQGRRYHISALYVVDLKWFRRIAAGDRLRGQYQALSQDPNSSYQVSAAGVALRCETWCDDGSKDKAKTIDLGLISESVGATQKARNLVKRFKCNNPMTKEAKLTAAVRILPEWKSYDDEIRELQKKIDSGLLDADPAENVDTIEKGRD
ncbi:hypothetical protein NQ317_008881 [Molorchus minor]|uniref:Uncharacterized protein n=1 Tax=Molorchus minor TaxID=1323400 RepID=A0ABQ9JMH4_9CUCU|nr:hypothetical protein NQ317_008881 [Molorchus minor]